MMKNVPSVSVTYAQNGNSTKSKELGMRAMQERASDQVATSLWQEPRAHVHRARQAREPRP
jgi:polyribonucleotide nucleotidyltransferase